MAIAVPSGMRSIATRKEMVITPVAIPRPRSTGTSGSRMDRSGGRARIRNTTSPRLSRSHAVPAGPTLSISPTDNAEPSCTENIAVTASNHGGTGRAIGANALIPAPSLP
jgi:hypothetical protein